MTQEPSKAVVEFVEGYNLLKDERLAGFPILALKVRGEAQAFAMTPDMLRELIAMAQDFLASERASKLS